MRQVIGWLTGVLFSIAVLADPGDLDVSFGAHKGWVETPAFSGMYVVGVIQQQNGKLVTVGWNTAHDGSSAQIALARYNIDGSVDKSFQRDGLATLAVGAVSDARSVVQQSDGKLVVGGSTQANPELCGCDMLLARFNADGSLDTSFNGAGFVIAASGAAQHVIQQSDGKLVAISGATVRRYNQDGTVDSGFNGAGVVDLQTAPTTSPIRLLQQADGKLVVVGSNRLGSTDQMAFWRLNADGSLDDTFADGAVSVDLGGEISMAGEIAQQPDGKLVAAGTLVDGANKIVLVRFNTDGTLDTSFNDTGKVVTTILSGYGQGVNFMALQPDGKFIVSGRGSVTGTDAYTVMARYNADGSLDSAFNADGALVIALANDPIGSLSGMQHGNGMVLQRDGKLVAVYYRVIDGGVFPYLARFLTGDNHDDGNGDYEGHGEAVASADMDGDGIDDMIVGAPAANSGAGGSQVKNAGIIRVISGKDHRMLKQFSGSAQNQFFGSVLATVADKNSDGVPDILVGEPNAGRVALYSGADGSFVRTVVTGKDSFGTALAYADMNNDGQDDLVVGEPKNNNVWVYDGTGLFGNLPPVALYTRHARSGRFGAALAVDSQHRLLVGSPASGAGHVDVFAGADGNSAPLFTLSGQHAGERFGSAVSAVKNSGAWVVGAPGANVSILKNGKKTLRKNVGSVLFFSAVDGSMLSGYHGNDAGDHFGQSVNALSDFDKDGVADVLVGAPASDTLKLVAGKYALMRKAGRISVIPGSSVSGF